MGHHCNYEDRVFEENGYIYRVTTATYGYNSLDVIKERLEDGKIWCKDNLRFTQMGGWLVTFDGEKLNSYYWGTGTQEKSDFYESESIPNVFISNYPTIDWYKDLIKKFHPGLKYLLDKMPTDINPRKVFEIIRYYQDHPEIETLIQMHQISIALNKNLLKLKKDKLKAVINFIKENQDVQDMNLKDVQICIKKNIDYKNLSRYKMCKEKNRFDIFDYLCKQDIDLQSYIDYEKMVKTCRHNINQEYWKFPKNFIERHNYVLEQYKNIIERNENKKNEIIDNILCNISNCIDNKCNLDGYDFYFPTSVEDIKFQAKLLNQCLTTMNYPKKVAEGKSLLVFIRKKNIPIATAEIEYDKSIKQFYANEKDRNNSKPNDQLQNLLKRYINDLPLYKPQIEFAPVL